MQYLVEEHGVHTVGLMRAIKEALDPHDIFNPGKIIGPAEAVHTHQETQE
jgi:D-lactate dehydrogenase (cytochrome)